MYLCVYVCLCVCVATVQRRARVQAAVHESAVKARLPNIWGKAKVAAALGRYAGVHRYRCPYRYHVGHGYVCGYSYVHGYHSGASLVCQGVFLCL